MLLMIPQPSPLVERKIDDPIARRYVSVLNEPIIRLKNKSQNSASVKAKTVVLIALLSQTIRG